MPALGAVSETGGSSGGDCMRRSPRSRRPQCPVKDARIQERMRDGRWACSHEFELEKADAGGVGRHLERRAHETRSACNALYPQRGSPTPLCMHWPKRTRTNELSRSRQGGGVAPLTRSTFHEHDFTE